MDMNALLEARSEDAPSGANLEYDSLFLDMELAANPETDPDATEQDAATEPNYNRLAQAAEAVLEQSHDLRAAAFLALARTRLDGLEGMRDVVGYIRGCLERYWDTCFPELEDGDAVMRSNAVLALVDPTGGLSAMRRAPLASGATLGSYSFRDISIAKGEVSVPEDMDAVPTLDAISAAFADTPDDVLAARVEAARAISADLEAIEAIFDENAPGSAPDLSPARDLLARILKAIPGDTGASAEDHAGDTAPENGPAADPPAAPAASPGDGAIRSSRDVEVALDRIITYYHRHEPSSPVPILLLRAKRLINADFLTIVRDMAPDGMENVTRVGGLEQTDE